ncbi:MAG: PaaI family thioesterase [Bacillota bacterium]|nr:PaaI family thioesterase [Bacillota bacterium]
MIGSKVLLLEKGECILSLKVEKHHLNPMGLLHGGVLMTMADTAAGCACSYEPVICPTVEGKLSFLAAGRLGDTIRVVGREIRHGGTLMFCEVNIYNQNDIKLAAGLFTYMKSRMPLPEIPEKTYQ